MPRRRPFVFRRIFFGLKPTSTRTALFPRSADAREAAVDDTLGGVSMPMVAVVDAATRFLPNAHALLGLALEKSGREAVRGAGVALDASRTSTVDACLFKTEAVRSEGAAGLDAVAARAGRPVLPGTFTDPSVHSREPCAHVPVGAR
jgi:hypothetical protein